MANTIPFTIPTFVKMPKASSPYKPYSQFENFILRETRTALLAGDFFAAVVASASAVWLTALTAHESFTFLNWFNRPAWFYWLIPAWLLLLHSVYDERRIANPAATFRTLILLSGIALGLYLGVFFLVQPGLLPRLVVLYFISLACLFTGIWRAVYLGALATRPKRLLIVGVGSAAQLIIQTINDLRPQRYTIVGAVDSDPALLDHVVHNHRIIGTYHDLLKLARAEQVSMVVLALTGALDGVLIQALTDCGENGIEVIQMASLYEHITGRVPIYNLDADWVVASLGHTQDEGLFRRMAVRLFDIVGSIVGLAILALMSILVAFAIWLDTGTPIFYKQTRSGKGGRLFTLYKFRTMLPDAELDGLPRWAEPDDGRVTGIGRILRRCRIDEMPQFWNVLKGEMSLIGPRPERPEFIRMLEDRIPFYRARLLVKPGITGWAQVNYGYAATVDNTALKLEYDLYYIKQRSFLLDTLIIWRTFITIARLEGT